MDKLMDKINTKLGLRFFVEYDSHPESPRQWCKMFSMVTTDNIANERLNCGCSLCGKDENTDIMDWLEDIMGEELVSKIHNKHDNTTDFLNDILSKLERKHGIIAFPVNKGDHSQVWYEIGSHRGWDNGCIGLAYITKDNVRKNYEVKKITKKVRERLQEHLQSELEAYTDYANGDVYVCTLEDIDGNELDCLGDLYYANLDDLHSEYIRFELGEKFTKEDWKDTELI